MTIFFNVTDAIGPAPNHGITRTERRLATALAGHVEFVMVHDGRAWRVDGDEVASRLSTPSSSTVPAVERFGVDHVRAHHGRQLALRRVRGLTAVGRADRQIGRAVNLEPFRPSESDVLVSVGLDWVHGFLDIAERHVFGAGGRFVGFCYDLIPVKHPEWQFPPDPLGFLQHYRRMTDVASTVVCISNHTRADLLELFPDYDSERVRVLRLGADATPTPQEEHREFAASLFDGAPYAVYCATIDRRKNHQVLYRAMRELVRQGHAANLVFVGRLGSGVDDLIDCLRHDPLVAGRIVHVRDCDDRHLGAIYQRARFAVYPSLYEGWGLGVTEALAHAKPCLVASGSSLGEAGLGVCRELGPLSTHEWVTGIAEYFDDTPTLPSIELPTWDEAARSLIEMTAS